jgi:hypothetical protein
MAEIDNLFSRKRSVEEFFFIAQKILVKYGHDPRCQGVLLDVERRKEILLAYTKEKRVPRTNNLIECLNSHLEGRLATIKGFQSMSHARLWLNAYFIYRRFKPFTDCGSHFSHLNGHCSLEISLQNDPKFQQLKHQIKL